MKLRYETGTAALLQFIAMVLLNFIGAIVGSITSCKDATSTYDCVGSIGVEFVYVILIAFWFGFVWLLAYTAQERRDHRLAMMLIAAESMILVVSLFNAEHYPNILGLITSLVDAAFAVWVIWLAIRLTKAKGGRITARQRTSTRRTSR